MGFRVWGVGFRGSLGFRDRVQGLRFGVQALGFRVWASGFRLDLALNLLLVGHYYEHLS